MNKVTICENTFEPSTWKTFETDDVSKFLFEHFDNEWPPSAHIYLDHVARNADITPYDDAGVERLSKIQGHFYVVVYPEGIELIIAIVAIAVAAVAITVSFLLRPGTPSNQQQDSSNNLLAGRQNKARPLARIPDIFGQVWATPDLLAVPYKVFVNSIEYEHSYLCVGRGSYAFALVNGIYQVRDDLTALAQIEGASARIFGPHNNPNNGAAPDFTIGPTFSEPVMNLTPFSGVNGQLLQAPNRSSYNQINYTGPILRFRSPNIIENNAGSDFTTAFQAGDTLYLGGQVANDDLASDPASIQPSVHLGGVYVISSVTPTQVFLSSPATVNANWGALAAFGGGVSNYMADSIMANNPLWIGGNSALSTPISPFFINHPECDNIWCNFVAPQGSYQVDSSSGQHTAIDVTIAVGVTPCDIAGTPTGGEAISTIVLHGSHVDQQPRGVTLKIPVTPGTGGVLVRAHRTSLSNIGGGFQVSDEVQWRDLYVLSDVCTTATIDFGDVTTIQTIIKATPQALAIKERKLNCLVTRKVPVPSPSGALAASTNAADILCAMALDPNIGNMQAADIDITGIYAVAGTGGTIQTYFASLADPTLLTQFSYTFDDATISFEEMASQLATAINCVAYRRGGLLSLSFEKQTSNSTLLFNHRNKVPKTETRTVTFGTPTGNDGIILDYIEPNAPNYPNQDSTVSLYFPPDRSAKNPKKVKSIGIRNLNQAMVLGWRLYWKLIAQNTVVQFDATEEAALSVLQDRILVADNTRPDTQDGEVIAQSSLLLTLSQNVTFVGGHTYSIFLQHYDETVESIAITAGPNPNQVNLALAPALPCVTDPTLYAKTTYIIVDNAAKPTTPFLLTEKTAKPGKVFEIKAVNYSDAYYQHDLDVVTPATAIYSPCGFTSISALNQTHYSYTGEVNNAVVDLIIPATTAGSTVVYVNACCNSLGLNGTPTLGGVAATVCAITNTVQIWAWFGVAAGLTTIVCASTQTGYQECCCVYELTPCTLDPLVPPLFPGGWGTGTLTASSSCVGPTLQGGGTDFYICAIASQNGSVWSGSYGVSAATPSPWVVDYAVNPALITTGPPSPGAKNFCAVCSLANQTGNQTPTFIVGLDSATGTITYKALGVSFKL